MWKPWSSPGDSARSSSECSLVRPVATSRVAPHPRQDRGSRCRSTRGGDECRSKGLGGAEHHDAKHDQAEGQGAGPRTAALSWHGFTSVHDPPSIPVGVADAAPRGGLTRHPPHERGELGRLLEADRDDGIPDLGHEHRGAVEWQFIMSLHLWIADDANAATRPSSASNASAVGPAGRPGRARRGQPRRGLRHRHGWPRCGEDGGVGFPKQAVNEAPSVARSEWERWLSDRRAVRRVWSEPRYLDFTPARRPRSRAGRHRRARVVRHIRAMLRAFPRWVPVVLGGHPLRRGHEGWHSIRDVRARRLTR